MGIKLYFKVVLAYFRKFKSLIILGLFLGVTIFSFLRILFPYFSSLKSSRVGIVGKYKVENLPFFLLTKITKGLTFIDSEGNPNPDLASEWISSEEGKVWTFMLRDNIYWHDRQKVVSSDIKYEFEDVTVEKPDNKTLVFKLGDSYSAFPSVLSKPVFKRGLVGTGAWQVSNISLVSEYVQKLTLKDKDKNLLTYKFYPTSDSAKLAFKLGAIDELLNLLDPKPFDTWKNVEVSSEADTSQVVTLFFNTQKGAFSEKNFRQALFYAIDKDNLGERALSPIAPTSWVYNPQVKRYDMDLERAKELIGSMESNKETSTKVSLFTSPVLLETAQRIASDWQKLGIETSVEVSTIVPPDFESYLTIFDIPSDPDQYPIWHSTQAGTNLSRYSSPRIDKILEDGRKQIDREERKKIYLDFQRFLLEDVPAAFLYHPTYFDILRK